MAFAISTVIGAVGIATSAVGIGLNFFSQKDASSHNAAAAQAQAQIGQLQASNVDVQKQQLDLTTAQQQLQIQTQKSVIEDQSKADAIREQASELDATRRRRDSIRQGIVARANSLTAATHQGASQAGSTALAQSEADISGQTGVNLLGVSQNLELGQKLFQINKDITSQYLNAQDANSVYTDQSKGLQQQVLGTQKQIYALGGDASSNYAQAALAQGNAAIGAGLTSLGTTVANSYPTLNRITQYFGGTTASTNTNYGYSSSTYGNGQT